MRRAALQSSSSPVNFNPNVLPRSPPPRILPDWFELRPFQYDGRVCIAALPGLCLALALSGELLLGVLVCGGLIIYFLQNGGAKRKAVLVYICVFIAVQVTVIYSAIPLLWQSPFNIITIFLLNMSVVMTGGWVIIRFEEFLKEEPSLAAYIEMALFSIFPAVSVGITCCILAVLTSYRHTPYIIIIHGFLLLRLFVVPSQPSFRKPSASSEVFVLGHAEISLLLILYVAAPAEVFLMINITNLLSFTVIGELLLVFSLPCFLLTLLELRTWTDCYGISYERVIWLRWISGILSVLLGSILLSCLHGSPLVDWLGVAVLSNVLLGWTSSHKGRNINRMFKVPSSCVVILVYLLAVRYSVPWHLILSRELKSTAFLLVIYAVLCVACFVVCSTPNQKLPSTMLIISTSLLVYIESLLHNQDLYSPSLMLVTALSSLYLLVRLRTADIAAWYCLWIGSALHAYKMPIFIKMVMRDQSGASGSLGTVILCLTVTKLLCFESRQKMNEKTVLGYILAVLISLSLSFRDLLLPLWYTVCDDSPSILQSFCMVIALTGLVCIKLTSHHLADTPQAHKLNLLVIISSAILFVLQPSFKLTESNFSDLLTVLAGILGLAVLLGIISPKENGFPLFLQSVVTGLATALQISRFVLVNPGRLTIVQYTVSCTACSFMLCNLWANAKSKKPIYKHILLTPVLSFLAIVALITYITEASQVSTFSSIQDVKTPCLRLYLVISLLLAFGLRMYCFIQHHRDPFGKVPSSVTLQSNLLTIAAFLLACLNCPIQPWEIWNSGSSLLLLSLQRDPSILTSLTSRRRNGIIIGACLLNVYSSTFLNSSLLNVGISLFALLEAAVLVVTLPVFTTYVLHQVIVNHNLNTELVAFLTPLNALFFLVGSSYTSWLSGGLGLGLGFWMLYEKHSVRELH